MLSSAVRGIVAVSDFVLLFALAEEPPCAIPGAEEPPDATGVSLGAGVAVPSPGFGVSAGVAVPSPGFGFSMGVVVPGLEFGFGFGSGFGSGEGCVVACLRRAYVANSITLFQLLRLLPLPQ